MSNETQYPPCPECGFERILVEGMTTYMGVKKVGMPATSGSSALWALMCTHCGHTTFYTKEPQKLVERRPDLPAR